ncbi:hypothetical protein V1509DRAFT_99275 [Lipomyces kononenkoae]
MLLIPQSLPLLQPTISQSWSGLHSLKMRSPLDTALPLPSPTICGITWNLYEGTNDWTIFSFVATSQLNDFSGDVNASFTYLVDNQGLARKLLLGDASSRNGGLHRVGCLVNGQPVYAPCGYRLRLHF